MDVKHRTHVIIALGSCVEAEKNLAFAMKRLTEMLTNLRQSEILWTDDYYGRNRRYQNKVVSGTTVLSLDELLTALKQIEQETGRRKGHMTLDADLLLYGDRRYHEDDWERPYIQHLLQQIS